MQDESFPFKISEDDGIKNEIEISNVQFSFGPFDSPFPPIAYVSFIINSLIAVSSVKIYKSDSGGLRLVWPQIQNRKGNFFSVFNPINKKASDHLTRIIQEKLENVLQEKGETKYGKPLQHAHA